MADIRLIFTGAQTFTVVFEVYCESELAALIQHLLHVHHFNVRMVYKAKYTAHMLAVCGFFALCTCLILHMLWETQYVCVSLADMKVILKRNPYNRELMQKAKT